MALRGYDAEPSFEESRPGCECRVPSQLQEGSYHIGTLPKPHRPLDITLHGPYILLI